METKAILHGVRLSAQKGRLSADLIRGKPVEQAAWLQQPQWPWRGLIGPLQY